MRYELGGNGVQKSFYGKAEVLVNSYGEKFLRSYSTIVAGILRDGKLHRYWDGWSATTARHLKAFMIQFMDEAGMKKKQWEDIPYEDFKWE